MVRALLWFFGVFFYIHKNYPYDRRPGLFFMWAPWLTLSVDAIYQLAKLYLRATSPGPCQWWKQQKWAERQPGWLFTCTTHCNIVKVRWHCIDKVRSFIGKFYHPLYRKPTTYSSMWWSKKVWERDSFNKKWKTQKLVKLLKWRECNYKRYMFAVSS